MRLILIALASCSACAPAAPHCTSRFASSRSFVVDELVLPRRAISYAEDLNGDGMTDNRLAKWVDAFDDRWLDLQTVVDRELYEKRAELRLTLHASSATFDSADVSLDVLSEPAERELIKALADFPNVVRGAAEAMEPHRLTQYLLETARLVHTWYHAHQVLGEPANVRDARLVLARASQIVLADGLTILGITAPERM